MIRVVTGRQTTGWTTNRSITALYTASRDAR